MRPTHRLSMVVAGAGLAALAAFVLLQDPEPAGRGSTGSALPPRRSCATGPAESDPMTLATRDESPRPDRPGAEGVATAALSDPARGAAVVRATWVEGSGTRFELATLEPDGNRATVEYDLDPSVDEKALCEAILASLDRDSLHDSTFLGLDWGGRRLVARGDDSALRRVEEVLRRVAVVGPSTRVHVAIHRGDHRPVASIVLDVPWRGRASAFEGTSWSYLQDYEMEVGMGGHRFGRPVLAQVEAGLAVTAERRAELDDSDAIQVEVVALAEGPTFRALSTAMPTGEPVALEDPAMPLVRWTDRIAAGAQVSVHLGGGTWAAVATSREASRPTVSRAWRRASTSFPERPAPDDGLSVTLVRARTRERWTGSALLDGSPVPLERDTGVDRRPAPGAPRVLERRNERAALAALDAVRLKNLAWEEQSLEQAAEYLGRATRLDVTVAPGASASVTLGPLDDVSAREVLDLVTQGLDLEWRVRAHGIEILPTASRVDAMAEDSVAVRAAWRESPEGAWCDLSLAVREPVHAWREVEARAEGYVTEEPRRTLLRLPVRRLARADRRAPAIGRRATASFAFDLGNGPEPFELTVERAGADATR